MRKKDELMRSVQRTLILEAAMQCFIENGLHQASMKDISTVSNLSPGQIYRVFEGKEAIIKALADEERKEAKQLIEHIQSSEQNIAKGLKQVTPDLINYFTNPSYAKIAMEFACEASRNKDFAKLFSPLEEEITEALVSAIKISQHRGTVRKSVDANTAAFVILSIFDGITGRCAITPIKTKRKLIKTVQITIQNLLV